MLMHHLGPVSRAAILASLLVAAWGCSDGFAQGSMGGTIGKEDKSVSGTRGSESGQPERTRTPKSAARRAPARGGEGGRVSDSMEDGPSSRQAVAQDQIRCHFRRRDQQFGWQRASQFRRFDARFIHRIWQGHRCGRSPLRRHGYRDLHPRRRLQGPLDRDQEVGSNGYSLVCNTALFANLQDVFVDATNFSVRPNSLLFWASNVCRPICLIAETAVWMCSDKTSMRVNSCAGSTTLNP